MPDKDDILTQIIELIISDEKFESVTWASISIIATVVDGSSSITGFWYDSKNDSSPETPENWDINDKFEQLRTIMADADGEKWHQCLVQIKRSGMKYKASFEYDSKNRWKINPKNPKNLPEEIRFE